MEAIKREAVPETMQNHVPIKDRLHALGEHLAAGFLELPDATPLRRMARALRRQLERSRLPGWRGEALYPSGAFSWYAQGNAISFSYSHSLVVARDELRQRAREGDDEARATYAELAERLGDYPQVGEPLDPDISLGGRNYTHSILNYGRIVREGLLEYERRIEAGLARALSLGDEERVDFYTSLADLMAGIRAVHARSLEEMEALRPEDGPLRPAWERLFEVLRHVPWQPARTFYEALVCVNFMYYLDGCDNLGRFDQDLGALYEADLAAGRLNEDEGVKLVGQMWANMDANTGWNVALGGSKPDGRSASNRLTLACLRAARGRRRPNLALRLTQETPGEVLDAALDSISSGCGIPALYNDALYLRAIREAHLNVTPEDLSRFAFGGCTELMIHGCSNVGSLDGGINLPLVLSGTLREHLADSPTFEAFWEHFAEDLQATVARLAQQVSQAQELHARCQPQPIRTLLVDDCLDAGVEFNAGGARYNWSVINIGGLGNVADSLAAVREVLYEQRELTSAALLAALESDFEGHEELRQRLARCPRYGNDQPQADGLAQRVARTVFEELRRYAPWRGGRFLPACLMFATYAVAGEPVGATPDGRRAGEPIADSIGAVQGRDRHGPTALIRSVASIPQRLAPGTLVTNFRFARSMFAGEGRERLKDLVRTYFALGGLQMQITVVDQKVLREALAHPERYGDLIVRIGGYSEYWRNLSQALRQTVLERTEHEV
jgi:formate C-acetyltransferase